MVGKIFFQEHPGAAHFRSWYLSHARELSQRFGVDAQELCGFLESQRFHPQCLIDRYA